MLPTPLGLRGVRRLFWKSSLETPLSPGWAFDRALLPARRQVRGAWPAESEATSTTRQERRWRLWSSASSAAHCWWSHRLSDGSMLTTRCLPWSVCGRARPGCRWF